MDTQAYLAALILWRASCGILRREALRQGFLDAHFEIKRINVMLHIIDALSHKALASDQLYQAWRGAIKSPCRCMVIAILSSLRVSYLAFAS